MSSRPNSIFSAPRWLIIGVVVMVLLAFAPPIIEALDQAFWLDVFTRMLILSIAAASLNLILGFGGMVSFGHAAFLGIGAYAVGIPAYYDEYSGFLHILLAVACAALYALITGAISLRTKGVHFIMITMAFGQMMFYGFVSLEEYGGDDGLIIYERSNFGDLIDMYDDTTFYYVCLVSLAVVLFIVHRLVNSRFGMVVKGSKSNERRMGALGFPTYRYRLTAYVISGAICGYAGALLGNFTEFISPEMMDWTRSGELIFMVVLGGTATIFGPVYGVLAFLVIEEILSAITTYWHLIFGLLLVLVVLFVQGGIAGLLRRWFSKKKEAV
ncbi:branched-chain amino acid ABC transporter permease [Hwanghaeella grinnelliae]|nr:branched-chain amino acid ABC transporter permease [Hwanghaeella grinnelliae]